MIKTLAKKIIAALGLNVSDVGNIVGTVRKNAWTLLTGGKSRLRRVNIGGGPFYKPGWGVLDYTGWKYSFAPGTVDWQHNLASFDPFPFPDNSIRMFYSSHCLEHIPARFHEHIFREIARCLAPGGLVRLTTPDFDKGYAAAKAGDRAFFEGYACRPGDDIYQAFVFYFCAGYLKDKYPTEEIRAALNEKSREAFIDWMTCDVPEEWTRDRQDHVSIWHFDRFKELFSSVGIEDVELSTSGGSRSPEMRGAGMAWGFDRRYPKGSIYVEATKPTA